MEDRTFVLWRAQQRVNFNEDDLTADRISAVFKVRPSVIQHLSGNNIIVFITIKLSRVCSTCICMGEEIHRFSSK